MLLSTKQEVTNFGVLKHGNTGVSVNRVKLIKKQKRLSLIDIAIKEQKNYRVPSITQIALTQRLSSYNSHVPVKLHFVNVFQHTVYLYKLIDLTEFVYETPLIKSNTKSIYHILDMVTVVDLMSLRVCGGKLMGILIGKILERSSKKGLFVRSLRILSKLPALIKKFEIREGIANSIRSWG